MKRILQLLISILPFAVHAQQTKKQTGLKKIFIGFNFSPDYDFRTLKNNDGGSSADLVIQLSNKSETGKFGYTTGLNACFNFTKRLGFETGIQYSDKGYQTKKQDLFYPPPPDPAAPVKAKFIYHYRYIDIPLKMNFTAGKSKIRFISSAGLTINFFMKETVTGIYEYANGKKEKKHQQSTFDYNKVNLSPMISLGLEYKLRDNIRVSAEPVFRYGVLKIIDQPVTAYLWDAGLNIGFYYGLK